MHKLYTLYAKALLNTAYRILNNREDAEDVLQESFLKAFKHLHQFNYQSTFGAWIKRIVINRSIDLLKSNNKLTFVAESAAPALSEYPAEDVSLEQQEKLNLLYNALHQLPNGYRTVFSLYMLEGYDHKEIASILNIAESASISQLSRAKKKLRLLTQKMESV